MTQTEGTFVSPFRDRSEAGRLLASRLASYAPRSDVIVLALPRGGIPVGAEIAAALRCPFFAFVVRKLGVPGRPDLAMGAVTSGGMRLINQAVTNALRSGGDSGGRGPTRAQGSSAA